MFWPGNEFFQSLINNLISIASWTLIPYWPASPLSQTRSLRVINKVRLNSWRTWLFSKGVNLSKIWWRRTGLFSWGLFVLEVVFLVAFALRMIWVLVSNIFFIFTPSWGNDPIWLIFFQMGGKKTPTSHGWTQVGTQPYNLYTLLGFTGLITLLPAFWPYNSNQI